MITTVIGSYPKPSFLKITDWFNAKGGTDTENPTKYYTEEISKMGNNKEKIFWWTWKYQNRKNYTYMLWLSRQNRCN